MSFDVMLRQMTAGFGQTCLIFFMTLIFSLPLGMLVYFGRVSRISPLRSRHQRWALHQGQQHAQSPLERNVPHPHHEHQH